MPSKSAELNDMLKQTNSNKQSILNVSSKGPETGLYSMLEIITNLPWLNTHAAGIYEVDHTNEKLNLVANSNLPSLTLTPCTIMNCSRCLCKQVDESENFLHIACLEQTAHIQHQGIKKKYGQYILPIKYSSEIMGVLVLHTDAGQQFELEQIAILKIFSKTIGHLLQSQNLHHEKRLADLVLEYSKHGVMLTDNKMNIKWVNKAFEEITGYKCSEVMGKKPSVLSSGKHKNDFYTNMWQDIKMNGYWEGEIWNRKKNGTIFPELLNIVALKNSKDEVLNYAAMFVDMSTIIEAKNKIQKLAYYDELTSLANRSYFLQYLEESIKIAKRRKECLTLLFLDLDGFKNINDTLGHNVGDQLLAKISARLKKILRESDFIARLGGDEFCILISNNRDETNAARIATSCLQQISRTILVESHEINLEASVGIAYFPSDARSADNLLKAADTAMYESKRIGKNSYTFYNKKMTLKLEQRLKFEKELQQALQKNQFMLLYQPKINIKTGKMCGTEALIRWNHPEMGMVPPDKFISILEKLEIIDSVGLWVIKTACYQLKQWYNTGVTDLHVAVNVSSSHFEQSGFAASVEKVILETNIKPEHLEIEITESMAHNIITLIETCKKLKKIGVRIAIDDFGTGYSSLSILNKLRIHTLKIDKLFIDDLFKETKTEMMLGGIISLAKGLGCDTVVEGVEKREQLIILSALGFDMAQGYYFSKPVSATEIPTLALKNFYSEESHF